MPLYMDVHYVPGFSEEDLAKARLADTAIQEQFGVTSLTYWLNKRIGTANCLMEAPSAEQVNALHKASHGLEAHKIIEVSEDVVEAFLGKIDQTPVVIDPGTTQTGSSLRIILFTDIVGSTQMAQDFGDEVAMKVLQTHDTIVRGALQMHGGSEVKHTGDGIMASFASVSGSVKSAIGMQNGIADYNQLSGHPVFGSSWEGFVIENLISVAPERTKASFYRTAAGAEMDLILELPAGKKWAVEIKSGLGAPLTKGFYNALEDIEADQSFVVYAGQDRYPVARKTDAISLLELAQELSNF